MIRLFLGCVGLVLSLRLFVKADDLLTEAIAILYIPIFVTYAYKALEKIEKEQEK